MSMRSGRSKGWNFGSWEEEGKDGVGSSHVVNRDGSRQKERLEVHYATAGTITTNVIEFGICSKKEICATMS
jgi:hypothetical protein